MRSDCLSESSGLTTISAEGASPKTLSGLRGPPIGIPSSKDAQASLEASWETPSKVGKASETHSGESKLIIVGLF